MANVPTTDMHDESSFRHAISLAGRSTSDYCNCVNSYSRDDCSFETYTSSDHRAPFSSRGGGYICKYTSTDFGSASQRGSYCSIRGGSLDHRLCLCT
eukprot:COSAG02_NODE_5744_length_4073_cov_4.193256_2_plen_97_part_00